MITPVDLAQVAANRIERSNTRFMPKADKEYVNAEHVDFQLDDALIRVFMNNHVVANFTVPAADAGLSRKAMYDKYGESAITNFVRDFRTIVKSLTISVPVVRRQDPGIEVARHVEGGVHVVAYKLDRPNGDIQYRVETLFGTLRL